ncbi:MAG: flagellar biosynthesis protein FlgA [Chloroflexales bacterium]|nr:flagellar biosynthesis protein FlgA [Chloroflexales bacterium]
MATTPSTPTLGQALTRKRANPLPALLLAVGLIATVGFAILGYLESQRTEALVVLTRDIPYGQQIAAEDVSTVELPLHRPAQLAGLSDPAAVVGQYAARSLGVNDLAQPGMLMPAPPTQPVYPNGEQLGVNMVPVPFSVAALGPVSHHDRVNLGFTDATGDPALCDAAMSAAAGAEPTPQSPSSASGPALRPYACRLISSVRVLWIDGGVAYLEMTPYQAQAIWAVQAAGVQLWGERYGITSDPLPAFDRLDLGQVNSEELLAPAPTPMPREDPLEPPCIPGANGPIPGGARP